MPRPELNISLLEESVYGPAKGNANTKNSRQFSIEQIMWNLREYLLLKVSITSMCERHGMATRCYIEGLIAFDRLVAAEGKLRLVAALHVLEAPVAAVSTLIGGLIDGR